MSREQVAPVYGLRFTTHVVIWANVLAYIAPAIFLFNEKLVRDALSRVEGIRGNKGLCRAGIEARGA